MYIDQAHPVRGGELGDSYHRVVDETRMSQLSERDLVAFIFGDGPLSEASTSAIEATTRCGGIGRLFLCSAESLAIQGFDPKSVSKIAAIREAVRRALQSRYSHDLEMNRIDTVVSFLQAQLAFTRSEKFLVLFLNHRNRLIKAEIMGEGTINQAPVYPREIAKRALDLDSTAVILCHNHPSEHLVPSSDDIRMTCNVAEALKVIGVAVHDHIIIGGEGHFSFRSKGLI